MRHLQQAGKGLRTLLSLSGEMRISQKSRGHERGSQGRKAPNEVNAGKQPVHETGGRLELLSLSLAGGAYTEWTERRKMEKLRSEGKGCGAERVTCCRFSPIGGRARNQGPGINSYLIWGNLLKQAVRGEVKKNCRMGLEKRDLSRVRTVNQGSRYFLSLEIGKRTRIKRSGRG